MRLPPEVRRALEATGRAWQIMPGTKHWKLVMDRRLVAVLPRHFRGNGEWRNIITAIRRHRPR